MSNRCPSCDEDKLRDGPVAKDTTRAPKGGKSKLVIELGGKETSADLKNGKSVVLTSRLRVASHMSFRTTHHDRFIAMRCHQFSVARQRLSQ